MKLIIKDCGETIFSTDGKVVAGEIIGRDKLADVAELLIDGLVGVFSVIGIKAKAYEKKEAKDDLYKLIEEMKDNILKEVDLIIGRHKQDREKGKPSKEEVEKAIDVLEKLFEK